MLETDLTRLVGCTVPIQLAGMGAIVSPELAAAVSEAGALGQISFVQTDPAIAKQRLDRLEKLTRKPYGVNLVLPYIDPTILMMAARRARVVDFFWGDPDPDLVEQVHAGGALASWQIGSVREAIRAEKAGCDFISAQGIEAGGHLRGQLSLLPLLEGVLDAVSVPVLATGGIGTARSFAAVLQAGAAGVRMGTRFIAAAESNAHPEYIQALIAAGAEDTVLTTLFEVDCPMCPATHRVVRSALELAEDLPDQPIGEMQVSGSHYPIPRFFGFPPTRQMTGRITAMACYAGQSVAAIRGVQPAGAIIAELVSGTENLLVRHAQTAVKQ
jgi:NAD(P)H-dependent flavin oxidoreductase YrpB (nitropropane dioxygenase family)